MKITTNTGYQIEAYASEGGGSHPFRVFRPGAETIVADGSARQQGKEMKVTLLPRKADGSRGDVADRWQVTVPGHVNSDPAEFAEAVAAAYLTPAHQ